MATAQRIPLHSTHACRHRHLDVVGQRRVLFAPLHKVHVGVHDDPRHLADRPLHAWHTRRLRTG
eukprot:3269185-Rhodomonas_salina.4